ncbi:4a-hydroxytetrahydrobiopterin dehydratase [Marinomonas agarivorans]|nr:4a-hydroxytetrahydrobiopterin dehydratase [Marinomonas agarivorans]
MLLVNQVCKGVNEIISPQLMKQLSEQIPDWQRITINEVEQLHRVFHFSDFNQAMQFAHQVAELAEQENHHPMLTIEWGKVTIHWWSHSNKNISLYDLICAAKTDQLLI